VDVSELRFIGPVSPLPVRVNFVSKSRSRWDDLLTSEDPARSLQEVPDRVILHEDMAIIQTYVNLRSAGLDVALVESPVAAEINVASSIDLGVRDYSPEAFVVAFRADWARPFLSNVTLTMNSGIATRRNEFMMPHWVQTGLIPRDTTRGDRMERLVFKGELVNLDQRFAMSDFARDLAAFGVTFRAESYDPVLKRSNWHDYSGVDAVLAIRSITALELSTKPAAKLVNAWAAGVPAILGKEPAFRELRLSELDYLEASTPDEVIDAVRRLATDAALYRAMIERGTERAAAYTNQRMVERWRDMLGGPVYSEYQRWAEASSVRRRVLHTGRALAHKWANLQFTRRQQTIK
jgi:hypothetical protein